MTSQSDRNRRRPRRDATSSSTSRTGSGSNAGEFGVQVGGDGAEPAVGIGSGLTVDSSGDVGMRVAPGVSDDLTQTAPDTQSY